MVVALFIAFLLAPVFELKLLFSLSLVLAVLGRISKVKKMYVWILLASLFGAAFILSPYWQVFSSPAYRGVAVVILIVTGCVWSYASSRDIHIPKITVPILPFVLLTGFILLINYKPLTTDIAWRGDESFHVFTLMHLVRHIRAAPTNFFLYQNVPHGWSSDTLTLHNIVRWPFFEKWINFLYLVPTFANDIRLYRLLPLLCSILLAWYLYLQFNKKIHNTMVSLLYAMGFVTIPLMYFYSTIVYLEMPIVLCATYCIFNSKDLLFSPSETLLGKPVWYAFLLLGFFKETVLIVIALLLILRLVIRFTQNKSTVSSILSECTLAFLALFPLGTFLFFRTYFIHERPYYFQTDTLLNPMTYHILGEALIRQIGVVFPMALAGFIVLLWNREKRMFAILFVLLFGTLCFFTLDTFNYVGYSRWTLFILPVVYYLAFRFLISFHTSMHILFLIVLFAGNIILSPVMLDGTRLSNWGCPNTDGAEYYYPYEKAIQELASNTSIHTVMLVGQYFPHWGIQFYLQKYNFYPRFVVHQFNGNQFPWVLWYDGRRFNEASEWRYLDDFFSHCSQLGSETTSVDAILYHSVNNITLPTDDVYCGKYRKIIRVSNSQNSIYIFQ